MRCRPRDVVERGRLWTGRGRWLPGAGEAGGGDRRSTGDPRAEKVLALRDTAVGFTRRGHLSKPADRPTAGVNPDVS